jgi:hypothetical protein
MEVIACFQCHPRRSALRPLLPISERCGSTAVDPFRPLTDCPPNGSGAYPGIVTAFKVALAFVAVHLRCAIETTAIARASEHRSSCGAAREIGDKVGGPDRGT